MEKTLAIQSDDPPKGVGRPPKEFTLEYLADAGEFQRILNATQFLTDEAYSDLINNIGWRAAQLVLRAKALQGDVRALDLYLRVCQQAKRDRDRQSIPIARDVSAAAFGPELRTESPADLSADDTETP